MSMYPNYPRNLIKIIFWKLSREWCRLLVSGLLFNTCRRSYVYVEGFVSAATWHSLFFHFVSLFIVLCIFFSLHLVTDSPKTCPTTPKTFEIWYFSFSSIFFFTVIPQIRYFRLFDIILAVRATIRKRDCVVRGLLKSMAKSKCLLLLYNISYVKREIVNIW